jgi:TPR repeat protein
VFTLKSRPLKFTLVVVGLSLLILSAYFGVTPQEVNLHEVKKFNEFMAKAEKGDAEAQFNVGYCYMRGAGVPLDEAQAAVWYRKAAEQGKGYAKAEVLIEITRMTPESVKVFKDFKAKAEKGDAEAQVGLGNCYANGAGVAWDYVQAAQWYRKAADQGHPHAQFTLGVCYVNGKGVTSDQVEAVNWWRKSAVLGYADAQFDLGLRYENGPGVEKDRVLAAQWYQKAADQGHPDAQLYLGHCYVRGEGVEKDEIEAYAYYNLAGIHSAYALHHFTILEKKMSREEIITGQKRTRELRKEIEDKMAANKSK